MPVTMFLPSFSIHASAKEATAKEISDRLQGVFNPRLREGGDLTFSVWLLSNTQFFNPRLREGGDLNASLYYFCTPFFNPRLREGGDICDFFLFYHRRNFSIHASAKEATVSYSTSTFVPYHFQSTPPRRRRPLFLLTYYMQNFFQSTPPRRRRLSTELA